jgi:hypothetical protein
MTRYGRRLLRGALLPELKNQESLNRIHPNT